MHLRLLTSLFFALCASRLGAAEAARPNFLFVYTDDQRYDALSVVQQEQGEKGRWPWLKTPNMDRIAREGVRFRNAFVVNSLCAPSRASLLTGCYGYRNGIVNNHTPLPENSVTYATLLRGAGYTTGFVGKWHMGRQSGQRPGFDYSASFIGQGQYLNCPFEINGVSRPTQGWVDDVSADYAIGFLREQKAKPFALALAFKSAHGPFSPPSRLAEFYGNAQARTVPNLGIPAIYLGAADYETATPTPPGEVKTNLDYHRCLHGADENLGRVLDELDRLGLTENTIVTFSSDNGFYLGEHRLGDKRSAYEESMRVPLLVRCPRLIPKGKLIDTDVLNIDLAPTLLDYAGVQIPREMQGRSWRPLVEGKETDWRRAWFYCYYYETNFKTPTMMAVRTGTEKLVKYPGHDEWTEVFDLKADPYELKNLAKNPDYTELRRQLEGKYKDEAAKIGFTVPAFADDEGKERRALVRNKETVLNYQFDKDKEPAKAVDQTSHHNDGVVHDAALVAGRDGHQARRFDGKGYIAVPRSPTLSPASETWSIEVSLQAEKPDGIIVAHGGASLGYGLYLEAGKPTFLVRGRAQGVSKVSATAALSPGWHTVIAKITPASRLELVIDGKPAGTAPLKDFIRKEPNDGLDIAADMGSQVLPEPKGKFTGLIESIRIGSE